MDVHFAA